MGVMRQKQRQPMGAKTQDVEFEENNESLLPPGDKLNAWLESPTVAHDP